MFFRQNAINNILMSTTARESESSRNILYEKKYNISKKRLEKCNFLRYTKKAVTLIAMKREVAARMRQVFRGANVKLGNWRQVTVTLLLLNKVFITACGVLTTHTEECTVTACRTVEKYE